MADVERKAVADMSVGEIKEALTSIGIDFSDCFEKADLIRKLIAHRTKEAEEKILRAKAKANSAYARAGYPVAIRYYSDALGDVAESGSEIAAQLRSNMSLALGRLDQVEAARAVAETCVKHAPWFVKGYLRVGSALSRQRRHREAAAAFSRGIDMLGQSESAADGGSDKVRNDLEEALQAELGVLGIESLESLAASLPADAFLGGGDVGAGAGAGGAGTPGSFSAPGCALLDMLSEDVLVEVMGGFLSSADVGRVAKTCRFFRHVCVLNRATSEKLWRSLCFRVWPERSRLNASPSRDWRTFSLERQTCDGRWERGLRDAPPATTMRMTELAPVFNVHKRGDVVASAEDCCVRIWDLARRTCERTLSCNVSGGHRMVLGVWLSEDQQTVLSGGADGDIKVWDIQKGTCGRVLTGHAGPVVTLKANETQIVSTSFDGSCRVWSWRGRCEQTLLGHRGHVCGLSFQPNDPANVWTGADDGLVKCWDMETARCLATLAPEREQHGSVWCVEAGASALLTGATDASVRIWDMSSRREVARLDGHREAVAGLQSDERRILTSAFDGTLRIWDWRNTAQCLGVVQMGPTAPSSHMRRCTRLSFGAEDDTIVIGCIDGCIYCVDVV